MKSIGFPISSKPNEKRRAILPSDIRHIKWKDYIFVEEGFGEILGFSDKDYLDQGINVCKRKEILNKDIICDPKIGDADYIHLLNSSQTIFGWIHAVQDKPLTDILLRKKITVYAWEDMYENGRHVFWRNNEIAGEAAIMHAYTLFGLFPYNTKVAIIGKGNIARGAIKILTLLGAEVMVYDRKTEKSLREEIGNYDVIVNAVLWDTQRRDHIIYKEDLLRMKKNSMIIDISCDKNGAIETTVPTSLTDPIYSIHGITHYAVDHTPTIFYKTISVNISSIIYQYINQLLESNINNCLKNALIIKEGIILDNKITIHQERSYQTNMNVVIY